VYLSLLRLDLGSADVRRDLRDPYDLHRTIMRAFPSIVDPEQEPRSFWGVLYRLEHDRRAAHSTLYVQSRVMPDWSFIDKASLVQDSVPNPATKSVTEAFNRLTHGRVLRFRLRANPTKKIDTKSDEAGNRRNGRRVPLLKVEEQVDWLARKSAQHGFDLHHVNIASSGASERIRSRKVGGTFQGVLYEGQLVVRDPDVFREALANGIGPGKAFGFGLLSIAPR